MDLNRLREFIWNNSCHNLCTNKPANKTNLLPTPFPLSHTHTSCSGNKSAFSARNLFHFRVSLQLSTGKAVENSKINVI